MAILTEDLTGQGAENVRLEFLALHGTSVSYSFSLRPRDHHKRGGGEVFRRQRKQKMTRKQCLPNAAGQLHM